MRNTLDKLALGEKARIERILSDKEMKNWLLDIGLSKNTKVECVLEGKNGEIKAYDIRGAIIALRKEDAKAIEIM